MRPGLAAGPFSRLREGFPPFGRGRKRQQVREISQIRLSVEISWPSQNLKVSHAAEMGSKANSMAFPRACRLAKLGSPGNWDAVDGKRVGERGMDIFFS